MDSITLRLHDLEKHKKIANILTTASKQTKAVYGVHIDMMNYQQELLGGEILNMMPLDMIINNIEYLDTEKKIQIINGRVPAPSHIYEPLYRVVPDKDFISFRLSIPKYIYGHQIAQFVQNPVGGGNKSFFGINAEFERVTSNWYELLMKFIKMFFKETFLKFNDAIEDPLYKVHLDWTEIEIVDFDLCFNQYFESEDKAKTFLNLAYNQIHKSHLKLKRESELAITPQGDGGLIVVEKYGYYKLYHKGHEFKKHDFRILQKKNDQLKKDLRLSIGNLPPMKYDAIYRQGLKDLKLFDVDILQSEANRILRHESRFVPASMSYFYKRHVYKKNCPAWANEKQLYKDLKNKQKRYERALHDLSKTPIPLTRYEKNTLQKIESELNQRHRFFVSVDQQTKDDQFKAMAEPKHFKKQFFSKELFNYLLHERFFKYVKLAQVSDIPPHDVMKQRVNEHNNRIDGNVVKIRSTIAGKDMQDKLIKNLRSKKITKGKMLKVMDYILRYGSVDEAYRQERITKSTYYRWVEDLKVLGMTAHVNLGTPIKTATTFFSYFLSIQSSPEIKKALFKNTQRNYLRYF